jgi:predicted ATPase
MVECSTRDLVCLYLDANEAIHERSPAPRALTALGIGDALELGETAAARVALLDTLTGLREDGRLTAAQRAVAGFDDPRTVYAVTDAGRDHATAVRDRVGSQHVTVTNGTTAEIPLADVDRHLDDDTPLVTALARLTDDDRVRLHPEGSSEFVDRTDELATVQNAIEQSFTREPATVVVAGASGMGKTALVREATDRLRDDHDDLVVATGASRVDVTDPYSPFRQAFDALPDGDALRDRVADATTGLAPDDPETVEAQRTALFGDIADGLRERSTDQPIVLFLDNLQWADDATLALFTHLTTTIDELPYPIAFVGTYRRPEVATADDHPLSATLDRIETDAAYTEVTLDAFSRQNTRALLAEVLESHRLPDGFVDLVYEQTGGNPLFTRETATHLLETDQVDPATDHYPASSDALTLPGAVTEQIDRRLATLDDQSRELLRLGAVLGERVPGHVLAEASALPAASRREYLDLLTASRLWEPVEDRDTSEDRLRPDGRGDFQFVSGGVREAVVERLPDTLSREYHARVADAFVTVTDAADTEQTARIAYHYEQAGDYERAVDYYRQAGDHAKQAYANEDALTNYERALALARDHGVLDDGERASVAAEIASLLRLAGKSDKALETAREALATAPDEDHGTGRLLAEMSKLQIDRGEHDEARKIAKRQQDLATTLGDRELEADALRHLGHIARQEAEYDRAEEFFTESLEGYRAIEDRSGEAKVLKKLGLLAKLRGNYDRARDHFERCLAIQREIGDRRGEGGTLSNLGILVFRSGSYDEAREHFEQSLAIDQATGNTPSEAKSLNNLGLVTYHQGDYEQAGDYFDRCLALVADTEMRSTEMECQLNRGLVAFRRGDYERAEAAFKTSKDIAKELDASSTVASSLSNLGSVARRRGEFDHAREHYDQALEINRDIGASWQEMEVLRNIATLTGKRENLDRARQKAETSLELAREIGSRNGEVIALQRLATVARLEGSVEQAREHCEAASDLHDEDARPIPAGGNCLERAQIALLDGDFAAAREHAIAARRTFQDLGVDYGLGRSNHVLGKIEAEAGATDDARDHWRDALETFETLGASHDALETLELLVGTCREQGDDAAAREWCDRARETLADAPDATAELHRDWVTDQADALGLE